MLDQIYSFIKFKFLLYKKFYIMKKNARIKMYNHVYGVYYKYYKRYTLFESFFFKQYFSDKMADDVIINVVIFKFINLRILYYIHRFIKPMPYFTFLEYTYDFINKKENGHFLLVMRDIKPFITRN
jgi:hypothetical protein